MAELAKYNSREKMRSHQMYRNLIVSSQVNFKKIKEPPIQSVKTNLDDNWNANNHTSNAQIFDDDFGTRRLSDYTSNFKSSFIRPCKSEILKPLENNPQDDTHLKPEWIPITQQNSKKHFKHGFTSQNSITQNQEYPRILKQIDKQFDILTPKFFHDFEFQEVNSEISTGPSNENEIEKQEIVEKNNLEGQIQTEVNDPLITQKYLETQEETQDKLSSEIILPNNFQTQKQSDTRELTETIQSPNSQNTIQKIEQITKLHLEIINSFPNQNATQIPLKGVEHDIIEDNYTQDPHIGLTIKIDVPINIMIDPKKRGELLRENLLNLEKDFFTLYNESKIQKTQTKSNFYLKSQVFRLTKNKTVTDIIFNGLTSKFYNFVTRLQLNSLISQDQLKTQALVKPFSCPQLQSSLCLDSYNILNIEKKKFPVQSYTIINNFIKGLDVTSYQQESLLINLQTSSIIKKYTEQSVNEVIIFLTIGALNRVNNIVQPEVIIILLLFFWIDLMVVFQIALRVCLIEKVSQDILKKTLQAKINYLAVAQEGRQQQLIGQKEDENQITTKNQHQIIEEVFESYQQRISKKS